MNRQELIPHLFRTEFSKISTVLSRLFGIENLQLAEDIASDTFLAALETWTYQGIPDHPVAWLYTVAKNKAKNHLKREQLFTGTIAGELKRSAVSAEELDWTEQGISDSQLQMMFTLCHPAIPAESQIGLSLRVLCGFGIDEIATAFLANRETINKRLYRAREKLREEKLSIEFPPPAEIEQRLDTVLTTLYLLFNEGYYSESDNALLREDLCQEAMRLVSLLLSQEKTALPQVHALYALMSFHASRFPARKNENGEIILYDDQDETLWDQALISRGAYHLHVAAAGDKLSTYHLEASIAYWHTVKQNSKEKWENILQLFNRLLQLQYSPVAALNRTYALYKVHGAGAAITAAEKLGLEGNVYYHFLLGELYSTVDAEKSKEQFGKALGVARTRGERGLLEKRVFTTRLRFASSGKA